MKKLSIGLTLALIIFIFICFAAYDFYKTLSPESKCVSECAKEGCDNQTGFSCIKDINNCYYKQYKDKKVGICNAECLTSDDCNESLKCTDNKCLAPRCGDGRCDKDSGENCETCLEDCTLDSGTICCSGKIVEGSCCSNNNCFKLHEICQDNQCVIGPYCGDKTCDSNENCETCRTDCKPSENQVCCTGVIKTGDCCKDSQCDEGKECKKNLCVVPSSS
ncbi:MAG: hypothetical protein PHF86_13015 [Candidatus Nanoarchaeia archaeon]|nr:hypothetical protein [Candidatus Nanoarchaeia archaeon]